MIETFSKRKRAAEQAGLPDVYVYDDFPRAFRVQVVRIWLRAIGPYYDASGRAHSNMDELYHSLHSAYPYHDQPLSNQAWDAVEQLLSEERGEFHLARAYKDPATRCAEFLLSADVDGVCDILDLTFRVIDRVVRPEPVGKRQACGATLDPDEAISQLNARLREHRLGYEFANSQLVRVDNEFVHAEVVKPALAVLAKAGWEGPRQEFEDSLAHLLAGETKDALLDAAKSFESAMKVVCDQRNWFYCRKATAKDLINVLTKNALLRPHYDPVLLALPTLRNKAAGHGQGANVTQLSAEEAAYGVHLAAANILLLYRTSQ